MEWPARLPPKGGGGVSAGADGVLRNNEGRWVHGYSLNMGICSVEEVELWAFVHGMRLAWEIGSKCI